MRKKSEPQASSGSSFFEAVGKIAIVLLAVGAVGVLAFNAGKRSGSQPALASRESIARPVETAAPVAAPLPPVPVVATPVPAPQIAPTPSAPPRNIVVDTDARSLAPGPASVTSPKTEPPSAPTPSAIAANAAKTLALPIAWEEARALMRVPGTVLVDARHQPDYDAGHIPGAISLPQGSSPAEIEAFKARFPTDRHLIVYCAGESCSLSKLLADILVNSYGYASVRYWTGGFREWNERAPGSPLEKSPEAANVSTSTPASPAAVPSVVVNAASTPEPAKPSASPITWAEAKPMLAAKEIVLVDARPKGDFEAGHIPDAVSLPQASTPEDFQAFKARFAIGSKVVVYCSSTSCAVSKQVADRLMTEFGYTSVWYMAGGFQEWQRAQSEAAAVKPN